MKDLESEKRVCRMANPGYREGIRGVGIGLGQGHLCREAIRTPAGEGYGPVHILK